MKITYLSLLCAVICLTASAQNEKKYLVHSSTNVIGCNTENRAVLMSPTSSSILPLTLIPQSDGTTVLALEGTTTLYLSLGTTDGWSTYFLSDANDRRAHYKLEQRDGYTLLRNSYTGKYLGTDANTTGSHVYSDKDGSDVKHLWLLSETP